jgi:hypothetical protein
LDLPLATTPMPPSESDAIDIKVPLTISGVLFIIMVSVLGILGKKFGWQVVKFLNLHKIVKMSNYTHSIRISL